MQDFKTLFVENSKLDDIYQQKYLEQEPQYFEKNCIGLLVELGEFANETKCFNYWSIKEPKRALMLEELADCIMLSLQFVHYDQLDLEELPVAKPIDDPLVLLNELFLMGACLMHDSSRTLILQIFVSLIQLGNLFGFSDSEIVEACYQKIETCKNRLNSDY